MAQINKPSDYFNTKLYTGNGSTQNITGVGFQPDFTWIKDRTTGFDHPLFDAVRGATKMINSNQNYAESTQSTGLTSFDSDGFTTGAYVATNTNNDSFASWNWKANGAGSANTDGSINSTVSANTTAGFSIVSYTGTGSAGATVGHGLGVKPDMIITKARAIADNWGVYHKSLGATKGLYLNTTNAQITSSAYYNNTEPTSTLVTLGENEATNDNDTMIMYAFAEKKGYSKFSSYVGNGNSDGTFVYTGFKPALVLVKASSATGTWHLQDSARNPSNIVNKSIYPNSSSVEETYDIMDFTSNGFKIRTTNTGINNDGQTNIYMAFAENPLVGTNNIPTTAR